MNKNLFIFIVFLFAPVLSFLSCDNTSIPEETTEKSSYEELYQQFQTALIKSSSASSVEAKTELINVNLKDFQWNYKAKTKGLDGIDSLPIDEQKLELQKILSTRMMFWIEKLEESFTSNTQITIEQIASDSILEENEKQLAILLLSGGDYLKSIISTTQTRGAAECYAQYQKDCDRALQMYAVTGSVGAITGGVVGLAGATAICALQLQWAEDDYKECLQKAQ